MLEIYLNVIEWGPGLYGLRPAARHYFGKEPQELTPKQMAFLVSLIPGPLKYQRSFAGGIPTPFFDGLMTTLLAKLTSVGRPQRGGVRGRARRAARARLIGASCPNAAPPAPAAPSGSQ